MATIATNSSANLEFVWLNPSWCYWVLAMLHNQDYQNPNIKSHSSRFLLWKTVSVSCKVVQRMYTAIVRLCVWDSPVIARELTTAVQIKFNSAEDNVMWSVTQILVPPVCIVPTSQFSNHGLQNMFYMTPISGMLAVFASKNKEVVQIRVEVLVWRQCLHG